jgi:L-2-hydroxyglutarate oxidase LhgO
LAKGNYVRLSGRSPFKRPIYPLPEPGGLGIHVTINVSGETRFGPDVEWLDIQNPARIDYAVDPAVSERFAKSIRAYWPNVRVDRLSPDYSGVRPKLSGRGEPSADFRIDGPPCHGVTGLINLFGIESPGLTSSLSIANAIAEDLDGRKF